MFHIKKFGSGFFKSYKNIDLPPLLVFPKLVLEIDLLEKAY